MPSDRIDRYSLVIVLALFFAIDLGILTFLLFSIKPPGLQLAYLVPAFILIPPFAIFLLIQFLWNPWVRRYPAQPIAPDAVSKTWQSFALGRLCRFNNCLIISVDIRCLHVELMPPLSWLGGRRVSIPWDRLSNPRPTRFGGHIVAKLNGSTVTGPKWCMSMINA